MRSRRDTPAFDNGRPIVAIDIDGTLGDYHGHFLRFAAAWLGKPMPDPSDINPGLELHHFMGITKERYRECKLAYRQGGLKRSMPVYDGAAELSRDIKRAGAEVWICTTRPYLRLDNIDPDTREWLRRAAIDFDAVIFDAEKYQILVESVGADRIVAVLDDLPEMVDQAKGLGLKTFIRDQPYNQHIPESYAERVRDLEAYRSIILVEIDKWKQRNMGKKKPQSHDPITELKTVLDQAADLPDGLVPDEEADLEVAHLTRISENALDRFLDKRADYASSAGDTGDHLGAAGQYAELYRKVGKLRKCLWDGEPMEHEQPVEILEDLIGHCIKAIRYLETENLR